MPIMRKQPHQKKGETMKTNPNKNPLSNLKGRHVLLVGPTQSGKTTALKYLLNQTPGEIHILDPHNSPNKWPANCNVHGGARRFQDIQTILEYALTELQNRAEQLEQGTTEFNPLIIGLDEQPAIVENVPNAPQAFSTISREGIKFNILLYVATQSDREKTLGIAGEGDVRDNFAIIKMNPTPLNFKGNSKTATLNIGGKKHKVTIPKTIPTSKETRALNTLPKKDSISIQEADPIDTNLPSRIGFGKALYETFEPTAKTGTMRTLQKGRQLFLTLVLGGTYAALRHKAK